MTCASYWNWLEVQKKGRETMAVIFVVFLFAPLIVGAICAMALKKED